MEDQFAFTFAVYHVDMDRRSCSKVCDIPTDRLDSKDPKPAVIHGGPCITLQAKDALRLYSWAGEAYAE